MRIAILGAPATGKTRLARDLMRHRPDLHVTDSPPLLRALPGRPHADDAMLLELRREHLRRHDLTLLTGLDLAWEHAVETHAGAHPQEQADAWLRAVLGGAGIAYQVVYGSGPERAGNALNIISHHQDRENRRSCAPSPWTGSCEKCSDPQCEHRLFTGLFRSPAADRPLP